MLLTSIASFLTSSAGGAVVGFVMDWMSERRAAQTEQAERDLKRDLAYKNQLKAHNASLDRAVDAKVYPRNFRIKLWGFEYETTKSRPLYAPRTWVVAYALGLLVTTYCAILLLWAGAPWETIYSIDPGAQPTRWGIPWLFMVESHPGKEPVAQNAGGVVFLMLHSLNFLLTTAIVGVTRSALRRR